MDAPCWGRNNYAMVKSTTTFAQRFQELRAGRTYAALADDLKKSAGIEVTAQTLHNWASGKTDITEDNLAALAAYYRVRPSWLRYGEGPREPEPRLEDVLSGLPDEERQQVFDFVRYKIERADAVIAKERMASYLTMIDRIRADMKNKKP